MNNEIGMLKFPTYKINVHDSFTFIRIILKVQSNLKYSLSRYW